MPRPPSRTARCLSCGTSLLSKMCAYRAYLSVVKAKRARIYFRKANLILKGRTGIGRHNHLRTSALLCLPLQVYKYLGRGSHEWSKAQNWTQHLLQYACALNDSEMRDPRSSGADGVLSPQAGRVRPFLVPRFMTAPTALCRATRFASYIDASYASLRSRDTAHRQCASSHAFMHVYSSSQRGHATFKRAT